jgi:hypothetical protein
LSTNKQHSLFLGVEPLSFAVQEEVKVISVLLQDQVKCMVQEVLVEEAQRAVELLEPTQEVQALEMVATAEQQRR